MLYRSIGAAVVTVLLSAAPAAAVNLHIPKSVVAGLVRTLPAVHIEAEAACPLRSVADITVDLLARGA